MRLINISHYDEEIRQDTLYELLSERTPSQSISHTDMPTSREHEQFVENHPYAVWYFITPDEDTSKILGTVYLTTDREIGITVFKAFQGGGYGSKALGELLRIHKGPFYANINPSNKLSMDFFEKHGFNHIQNTLKLEAVDAVGR